MKVVKEEKDHHPSNLSFLGGNSVTCGNQTQVQNWARPTTGTEFAKRVWNLLAGTANWRYQQRRLNMIIFL